MAPNPYLPNSRSAATVRTLDQAVGGRTVTNPLTSQTQRLTDHMADPVAMGLAHGVTGDPAPTPNFTMFANPVGGAGQRACATQYAGNAWTTAESHRTSTRPGSGWSAPASATSARRAASGATRRTSGRR